MIRAKKSIGIRKNLVRSVTMLVILPLVAVIAFLSVQVGVNTQRQTLTANETYVAQIATNIDQVVEVVNYATSKLMLNLEVLSDLRTVNRYGPDSYAWYVALRRLSQQVENLESSIMNAVGGKLMLLTRDNYLIHYTYMGRTASDYTTEDWYLSAQARARAPVYAPEIINVFFENPTYTVVMESGTSLLYARALQSYSRESQGVVLAQLSSEKIWNNYLGAAVSGTELYLVGEDGAMQMCSVKGEVTRYQSINELSQLYTMEPEDSMSGTTDDGYFYRATRLTNSPNILICMQPAGTLFAASRSVTRVMLFSVLGLTLMILLIFIKLAGRITRPITEMVETMDNSPDIPLIPIQTESKLLELNKLADSYNHAWERVGQLLVQVREETRLREETYYEMLMSQISPHFICNTVNSIKYLAGEAAPQQTVEALEALGDILQSVYDNKSDITMIAREVQLLSSYVKIMRMRFGYTFQYIEDIPFELYMCEIPTFTLQPLVENAILHGVLEKQAGQIVVSAQATDTNIQISVFNNSPCDDIQKVYQALREETHNRSQFTGIGLYNINARLRILYGKEYGLAVDAHQESGFEVLVNLPRKEKTFHAEDANC
ncbi:histidine kinase [Eubacteriales bacterium OttesenSCG-928-N13]|nr:histidine kinase [Eubacteriales bacterium OttesenSCG-928-N13]